MATFWRFLPPAFPASCVQYVSDLHPKFALRSHHVWKYGRHPTSDRWDYARKKEQTTGWKYIWSALLHRVTIKKTRDGLVALYEVSLKIDRSTVKALGSTRDNQPWNIRIVIHTPTVTQSKQETQWNCYTPECCWRTVSSASNSASSSFFTSFTGWHNTHRRVSQALLFYVIHFLWALMLAYIQTDKDRIW